MIDVDHFKLLNDRFGYAASDERDWDVVARLGGEDYGTRDNGGSRSTVCRNGCDKLCAIV
jgi:predicted signal transduction protein with EAL and GGDEF domain